MDLMGALGWCVLLMAPVAIYGAIGEIFFAFERAKAKKNHPQETA